MDFNDFMDKIVKLGVTKGSLEKRCGYYSGKLTELQKGRVMPSLNTISDLVRGLESLSEEINSLIDEASKITEEEIRQYTVYEFTFPNEKKYYGHSVNPEARWKNGKGYDTQEVGKAIKEFGWENVQKKIIAEKLTKENALLIERTLIKATGADIPAFGYNIY